MALYKLPIELHCMIADQLEKEGLKIFRLLSKYFAGATRQLLARKYAPVRSYSITIDSWAESPEDEVGIKGLLESLRDDDFGAPARVLRIKMPAGLREVRRLLREDKLLPGLLRAMEVFSEIEEVILETLSDSSKPYYSTQWIPSTMLRTLAKRNANVKKLTLVSARQQGGDIMVTGAGDPYGRVQGVFPGYMLPVFQSITTLRLELGKRPDVKYAQPLWGPNFPNIMAEEYLVLGLGNLRKLQVEQFGQLDDYSDQNGEDALKGLMPFDHHFANLSQLRVNRALLNEGHLDRFLRLHSRILESINLSKVVFMQTNTNLFEKNWWNAIATLYVIANVNKKLKKVTMDNCWDAIQTMHPFPAFAVDFNGNSCGRAIFQEANLAEELKAMLKSQVPYVLPAEAVITDEVMRNKPSSIDTALHDMLRSRMEGNEE